MHIIDEAIMYEITLSMGIDIIDIHEYWGAMAYEHVLGNEKEMARSKKSDETSQQHLPLRQKKNV